MTSQHWQAERVGHTCKLKVKYIIETQSSFTYLVVITAKPGMAVSKVFSLPMGCPTKLQRMCKTTGYV